ncbi:MAG: hypothetical protein ACJAUP_000625 [Cellvibrionaceae bacterium]|jgi:hypothetical protein
MSFDRIFYSLVMCENNRTETIAPKQLGPTSFISGSAKYLDMTNL